MGRAAVLQGRKERKKMRKEWKKQEMRKVEIKTIRQEQTEARGFGNQSMPRLREPLPASETAPRRFGSIRLRGCVEMGGVRETRGLGSSTPLLRSVAPPRRISSIHQSDQEHTPNTQHEGYRVEELPPSVQALFQESWARYAMGMPIY